MSTNMLTWDELEAHLVAGTLMLWDPRKQGVRPSGRGLYMLPSVYQAMSARPWLGTVPGERKEHVKARRQAMRAVLERFTIGGRLTLNWDIAELGSKIRRPTHRGFWEFKSSGPWVETRLFGFFARQGAFVALALKAREGIDYRQEYSSCRAEWSKLTGGRPCLDNPYPVDTPADLDGYLERDDDV